MSEERFQQRHHRHVRQRYFLNSIGKIHSESVDVPLRDAPARKILWPFGLYVHGAEATSGFVPSE